MGPRLRQLLESIKRYRLDHRYTHLRMICEFTERGEFIDEWYAEGLLLSLKPQIDEQERRWNGLHRAPTFEELYPRGNPDVVVGRSTENDEVPIGLNLWGAFHVLCAGATGAGKTVALRRLINAIEAVNRQREKQIVIIILDYKGHDFGDMREQHGEHCRHFDVHGLLRLGLQNPIGVPPNVWINHIATSFAARSGLIASWVTLANLMRWLVGAMNASPSDQLQFPDFRLMLDTLNYLPAGAFASKAQYLESLIQVLEGTVQASGSLFESFSGLDLNRDLIDQGHSAVFSMANISPPWLNQFIADLFVYQLLLGRIARQHRVDEPEVILVIDEADPIVSQDSERLYTGSMPPIVQLARQGREFGIGLVLGLGSLGQVSENTLNSMAHHFIFRMPDADSVHKAAKTLQLPPHSSSILSALEPGECLARLSGPWSHAMLSKIDYVEPNRSIRTDYDANPNVPATLLRDMPELQQAADRLDSEYKSGKQRRAERNHAKLQAEARELLARAADHPYWPVVQLYKLGTPPSFEKQKKIHQSLEDNGYAELKEMRAGRRNLLLIELKDKAWTLLGKPLVPLRGRGGLPHRCMSAWVAMLGERRGYEAVVEWVVPGSNHPCDVAWGIGNGEWTAYEIAESCTSNIGNHLSAVFLTPGTPVTTLTVVAAQRKTLAKIQKQVSTYEEIAPFSGRVQYMPIADVYMELWPS